MFSRLVSVLSVIALLAPVARAWDFTGHRAVNELALTALPADFPAFVREPAATRRVIYLANVPDRWRNVDPWLKQVGPSWTDHFIDIEQLAYAGLDARTVSSYRYNFAVAFAAGRAAHPDKFRPIDPAKNTDETRQWLGFAPWAIAEWTQKVRAAFGYLKAYQEMGGTEEEILNAQEDAIYAMGVLGHYVGDCAQPLHTTDNHNGWYAANPNGYTKWAGFHSWIDSGLIAKAGITVGSLKPRMTTAEALPPAAPTETRDPIFVAAMDYILASHELVEPLYQLEKAGKLGNGSPENPADGPPVSPEGRAFIEGRLVVAGQMLAKLWVTAWKSAPTDAYLRSMLAKRQVGTPAPGK